MGPVARDPPLDQGQGLKHHKQRTKYKHVYEGGGVSCVSGGRGAGFPGWFPGSSGGRRSVSKTADFVSGGKRGETVVNYDGPSSGNFTLEFHLEFHLPFHIDFHLVFHFDFHMKFHLSISP